MKQTFNYGLGAMYFWEAGMGALGLKCAYLLGAEPMKGGLPSRVKEPIP